MSTHLTQPTITWLTGHPAYGAGAHEAPWLAERRRAALTRFEELGLPTRRDEDWKYTSTRGLAGLAFAHTASSDPDATELVEAHRLEGAFAEVVLVNGQFVPVASRLPAAAGMRMRPLSQVLRDDPEGLRRLLGEVPGDPFGALNSAFLQDGAVLELDPDAIAPGPVHVLSITVAGATPVVAHPRLIVRAGRHSRGTLVESHIAGDGATFTNVVTDIALGDGAQLTHHLLRQGGARTHHVGRVTARVGRDARFTSHTWWLGGGWVRNDLGVTVAEGSETALRGLYVVGGGDHVDNHTVIDHAAPHATSRELYKGVLGGSSTAVFNGRVLVRQGALKTDASQTNRNVLLSDDATVNTKPELEIYADDVKCAHGTTVGQLEDEQLWYLRSRGIDRATAENILTRAFAWELLDDLDPVLRAHLEPRIEARLDEVRR